MQLFTSVSLAFAEDSNVLDAQNTDSAITEGCIRSDSDNQTPDTKVETKEAARLETDLQSINEDVSEEMDIIYIECAELKAPGT